MIPDYWSPQEALPICEFIDEIWNRYGLQLVEIHQAEQSTDPAGREACENSESLDDELYF